MSASPRRITDYSNPCLGCEHPCFKNVTRQKNKAWTRDSRRTFTALLLPSTLELRCCGCWASDLEIHDLLIDAPNQRAASMTKSSRQGSCGFFITSSTRTTRTVGSQKWPPALLGQYTDRREEQEGEGNRYFRFQSGCESTSLSL